jgi:hypothetical protein
MTATALLAQCRTLGVDLATGPDGALIWEADFDPPAELLADLAAHKDDVLVALDTAALDLPGDVAELQAQLDAMMSKQAWADGWAERLRYGTCADLSAVRRTTAMMVKLAAERHAAGDAAGFSSWCRFILAHSRGENWDSAARLTPPTKAG